MGGVGVVGVAGFAYFGLEAQSDLSHLRQTCAPFCASSDLSTVKHEALIADAPANLEIVRHYAAATDITQEIGGRETVWLSDGQRLSVDHVVLTSGHTLNQERATEPGEVRYLRPYPVEYFDGAVAPGEPIAVAGMGLVGYDLITTLTTGRGGEYKDEGDRKTYVPSGREPAIYLYSRSGVPYCAKSAHGVDPTGDYQPVVCTPEAFRELTNPLGSPLRRRVDFRNDLLPLLYAEMQVRYYVFSALRRDGATAAQLVRDLRSNNRSPRAVLRALSPRRRGVRRGGRSLCLQRRLRVLRLPDGRIGPQRGAHAGG